MKRLKSAVGFWIVLTGVSFGQATFEDPPHWSADLKDNVFQYGELKELSDQGTPVGWNDVSAFGSGHAVMLKNSKGIIQLKCPEDDGIASVSMTIDLTEVTEFVTILSRMRGPTIELGKTEEAGAGIVYSLITGDGQSREFPRVEPIYKYGSLGGWKTYRSTVRVLPGERQLKILATIVDSQGALEVDRVLVIPSEPSYQPEPEQLKQFLSAVREDDRFTIARMVAKTPELLELRNGYMENGTPLIWASMYNSKNVAEELVQAGADLEVSDESWQNTPLAWCCWWGNLEVAEVLLKAGAQTKHYAKMAASAKKNNRSPRGSMEDFDKIAKLIEETKRKAEGDTGQ